MTAGGAAALRLGCVQYLNAQPLIHGWRSPVIFDHPSAIGRQLASGALEVAFVSAFEYLRHPIYTVVDDVAVAAEGAVYSVFLAHRRPLDEITRITLDPASATSVNLLRCLLAERGLSPTLQTEDAEARLLIGDQAIAFREQHRDDYQYLDLGAEWKTLTGLPFVFALWLIRPEVRGAEEIAQALRMRRDANLVALDEVIAAQKNYSAEFCAFYFRDCLRFHFGPAEKEGLWRFRALCEKHSLLPAHAGSPRLV